MVHGLLNQFNIWDAVPLDGSRGPGKLVMGRGRRFVDWPQIGLEGTDLWMKLRLDPLGQFDRWLLQPCFFSAY